MVTSCYIDDFQIQGGTGISLQSFQIGSPAPRDVLDLRPSDHGATDDTRFYGARSIEMIGVISRDTMAELWESVDGLKQRLALGSTHVLKFRREGLDYDERATVRVGSPVDIPVGLGRSPMLKFGVSLLAPDPRIYTDTQSQGAYDPTDSGTGGLVFPLEFPLDFQVSDTAGRLTVDNEGTIGTPPVFVIEGPVVNPIIDNDTTGESIYTQGLDLSAGDTLHLDVASRSVLLNGTTSRPDLIDVSRTVWFNLPPGSSQLRLRGTGMSAGTTELSVTFRSARI